MSRIAVFIDGANVHATAKALGFEIDYKRFKNFFEAQGDLVRIFYYTTIVEDAEFSALRPLVDWLDYNGYSVVTKSTKEFVDDGGRRRYKGNMSVELTVDALELAVAGRIDQMILLSGDGDYVAAVEAVKRRGVRVKVISTVQTAPPIVADDLRRCADEFEDLTKLRSVVEREVDDRRPRTERYERPERVERGFRGRAPSE